MTDINYEAYEPVIGLEIHVQLNTKTKMCNIYEVRPKTCSSYYCQYIKSSFLVRTPANPNIYTKIR